MTTSVVYPELVAGRRDGFEAGPWRVVTGWARRGEASCDFVRREIRVPLGTTDLDRVVRAHELVHLRISPHDVNPLEAYPEIPARALQCAEECRVNEVMARLDFDVSILGDGSERLSGVQLARANDWPEAVYFQLAVLGTGAEKGFVSGLRAQRPDWLKALRIYRRRALSILNELGTEVLSSTQRDAFMLPLGFTTGSLPLARLAATVAGARVPDTPEGLRSFRRSLESGGRRLASGRFATLVFDTELTYRRVVARPLDVKKHGQSNGTVLRFPGRLLTDPHRRAFAQRQRVCSGLVIVDQSGSMDLADEDLERTMRAIPGVVVVGYSHRPGDCTGAANAWILADRGQRATSIPVGNIGNGVDGPILEWARRHRRVGERIIWVTDGQVTDSNDHPDDELTSQCVRLVQQGGVELATDLDSAIRLLVTRRRNGTQNMANFGRIGRKMLEMRGVTSRN